MLSTWSRIVKPLSGFGHYILFSSLRFTQSYSFLSPSDFSLLINIKEKNNVRNIILKISFL